MKKGGFTFVLHSHLPYTRLAGRWPHGEETIHECAAETYIPLLNALNELRDEGLNYKLTIGITPVLTEQLADALVLEHFEEYLQLKIAAAEKDIERYSAEGVRAARLAREEAERRKAEEEQATREAEIAEAEASVTQGIVETARVIASRAAAEAAREKTTTARQRAEDPELPVEAAREKKAAGETETERSEVVDKPDPRYHLAIFYRDWYTNVLTSFTGRYHRNIVGAFKELQDAGCIEIITSAATHGYLPLMARDSTVYGQLKVGIGSYLKHFGLSPRAIWLPECAYRPAYYETDENGKRYYKPGLEEFLHEVGLSCFFVETHTIEGGVPVGKAAGEVVGPYSFIKRRYVLPPSAEFPETHKSTFQAYWVQRPEVAVMGRNNRISMQVWSAKFGYPGEKDYREFHKKDDESGLQYWRVTGPDVDLGDKDFYNPEWTGYRVNEHSDHFVSLVEQQINEYYDNNGKLGIICANYDTELFGHWWFEGVSWIKEVLRKLSKSETVELTSASDWIERHPPEDILAIPESSWGQQGTHFTWLNENTEWMWPEIHAAERRMENLVRLAGDNPDENLRTVMEQATREALLLESSDWPFLVTTVQAADYATERFKSHVDRFNELAGYLEASGGNPVRLSQTALDKAREYFYLDVLFPQLDYTVFAEREQDN